MPQPDGTTRSAHLWTLAAVWLAAALYLLPFVHRGWIPGDEGLLAQSAERVLAGELPHRDFDDMYTGGQALLHAAAMHVFGLRLDSLRWLLYAATLLALPLVYLIAARVAPPLVAAAVTVAAVVWTVPNYFAAMPSWYNLYLALAAVLALLRHVDSGRRRWLFVAGLCAGVSFLFKSAALLLIAAVFLFLLYREQELDEQTVPERRRPGFALFVSTGLVLFLAVLAGFIVQVPRLAEMLLFVGPSACLVAALMARCWLRTSSRFTVRAARLAGLALPFLAGVALPCAIFAAGYQLAGGFESLAAGEFLFVGKRLLYTTYPLPPAVTMICVLPVLALLLWPYWRRVTERGERRLLAPLILAGCLVVALGSQVYVYQTVWYSVRPSVLAVTIAGTLLLLREIRRPTLDSGRRQALFLLLAVMAVVSVLQFPYSWGIYFCYVAPLVLLAALFLVRTQPGAPQRLHLAVLGAYTLFGALWLNLGWVETHSWFFQHRTHDTPLPIDRGGLLTTAEEARIYGSLVDEVRRHSAAGAFIFAAPDCPEVYFLTGRRNPTRSFCDYFEDDYDSPRRSERLLRLLDEHEIDVVVLNWRPAFSRLPADFAAAVFERFPHRVPIPPHFTVHWRERPEAPPPPSPEARSPAVGALSPLSASRAPAAPRTLRRSGGRPWRRRVETTSPSS